jgi:GNAT superfamily N-acetyltransferase
MNKSDFDITEIRNEDSSLIASFISDSWGSPMSVSKGRIFNTTDLPGFIQKRDEKTIGLVTYNIDKNDCEIVTLDSKLNNRGLATQLINKVVGKAKNNGCKRVWLITTNDNTNAIRFYQKRGFEWVGFYRNSMDDSRKLKPEIPEFGDDDIPIKHEIEFELRI